jgi:hypothetical protein
MAYIEVHNIGIVQLDGTGMYLCIQNPGLLLAIIDTYELNLTEMHWIRLMETCGVVITDIYSFLLGHVLS